MQTPAELQALIAADLGQDTSTDEGKNFLSKIGAAWRLYEAQGDISLELRYLYTKRHMIESILGNTIAEVTVKDGDRTHNLSDIGRNLQALLRSVGDRIARIEGSYSAPVDFWPAVAAPLDYVTPRQAPLGTSWIPDPNDTRYKGDPFK